MTMHTAHATESWQSQVQDERERLVLEALSDERWDFRTIAGIARETGLSEDTVAEILDQSEYVRLSGAPGADGSKLFTLKSQPVSPREGLAASQAVIAKTAV